MTSAPIPVWPDLELHVKVEDRWAQTEQLEFIPDGQILQNEEEEELNQSYK